MASKTPVVRLLHIKRELDWMLEEFEKQDFEAFSASLVNIRSVEHGFLIISEAVRSLPAEMTETYPQIAWAAIRAFGNVLRHDYEQIEPRRLWVTLTQQLPELRDAVTALLEKYDTK